MIKLVPTIGIETHVQLRTKTKLFSSVDNDARQAQPNSLISHIDVGLPGALPVLNQKAVELACRAAFALKTKPQAFSKFDRKHYFYPDLPKGYQITQYEQPIILGGYVQLPEGARIGITRVHLEEDAGKNTHPAGADYSLVDLNRAGTPLLEIVSEPEIHSAADAKAYARELWLIMRYAGVTDGDLYHGHVRFDVNISVSSDPKQPGVRTEIKNLNSFRSVEAAVNYEIKRQSEDLANGNSILQETRGWDEAKQKTTAQRDKEEAHDYRYMPEPDVPPLELDVEFLDGLKTKLLPLPVELRTKLSAIELSPQVAEDLLDSPPRLDKVLSIFDKAGASPARRVTFWLLATKEEQPGETSKHLKINDERLIELAVMAEEGKLSSTAAERIYKELAASNKTAKQLAEQHGLIQQSDEAVIESLVDQVIKNNPKVVADIKAGQDKAIGFLVGQVMAASKGSANPGIAQKLIRQKLGI